MKPEDEKYHSNAEMAHKDSISFARPNTGHFHKRRLRENIKMLKTEQMDLACHNKDMSNVTGRRLYLRFEQRAIKPFAMVCQITRTSFVFDTSAERAHFHEVTQQTPSSTEQPTPISTQLSLERERMRVPVYLVKLLSSAVIISIGELARQSSSEQTPSSTEESWSNSLYTLPPSNIEKAPVFLLYSKT